MVDGKILVNIRRTFHPRERKYFEKKTLTGRRDEWVDGRFELGFDS